MDWDYEQRRSWEELQSIVRDCCRTTRSIQKIPMGSEEIRERSPDFRLMTMRMAVVLPLAVVELVVCSSVGDNKMNWIQHHFDCLSSSAFCFVLLAVNSEHGILDTGALRHSKLKGSAFDQLDRCWLKLDRF